MLTKSIESSLCDYSDEYILVTGNINVTGGNNNKKVAFKNCAPFKKCSTEIDGTIVDEVDFINSTMPMHNLINIVIIILILQEVYGILKEMK